MARVQAHNRKHYVLAVLGMLSWWPWQLHRPKAKSSVLLAVCVPADSVGCACCPARGRPPGAYGPLHVIAPDEAGERSAWCTYQPSKHCSGPHFDNGVREGLELAKKGVGHAWHAWDVLKG